MELIENVPPQDLEAEKSVLGSILLVNESIDEIAMIIRPEFFYVDVHQLIYECCQEIYNESGGKVDTITLANLLTKKGKLNEVGGPAYLIQLLETVPHAQNADYYARIVRDKWVQRSLIHKGHEIMVQAQQGACLSEDLLADAERSILSVGDMMTDETEISIKDIMIEVFEQVGRRSEGDPTSSGVRTGFETLDSFTQGIHPTQLVCLAARPGIGKTALVCNIMLNMAREGKNTLIFSLEQSKLELAERFLSIYTRVDAQKIRNGNLEEMERNKILDGVNELGELPIFIDDNAGRTVSQIGGVARRKHKAKRLDAIFIDYLQLIEPEPGPKDNREREVANMTRKLKRLAKDMNVPIVILSQLNRGVEQREDKRPRLADIRESGAIEQDADVVMFLHRPDSYDPEVRPGEADIIVAKQRSGPTGTAPVFWDKKSYKFMDKEENYEKFADFA